MDIKYKSINLTHHMDIREEGDIDRTEIVTTEGIYGFPR